MPTIERMRRKAFVGTAKQVSEKLRKLVAAFDLDEIVINTWVCEPSVLRHS